MDPTSSAHHTAHDAKLAEWLDRLLSQYQSASQVDWARVERDVPELVDELRQLFATAAVAEELAGQSREIIDAVSDTSAAAPPLEIDDYQLEGELGRGGMGVVYRAWQKSLNRPVAIKQLLRGSLASQADIARFRAEAESAARLTHPHIVPIYEVGIADDAPFFSMQFIEGTTLAERIAAGPLTGQEAAEILLPICRAVAHAHRQGILHRDLKPSNILLASDGTPYVTDFGLAKWISEDASGTSHSLTLTGAILGTPSYVSPEQAAGKRDELCPASDVYGLGAILYAMLTGRAPFQAATPLATLKMVQEEDPIPPRVLNPQADRDLELIALRCLQKPIDLRFASADELADDLERYLANEPVLARSSKFSQILTRAFRETHHASVLQNWGLLWMWHSLVLMLLCLTTNALQLQSVTDRWPYMAIWIAGAGLWAAVFWELRRRAGPVTFVERVIAHVWAASMITDSLLFAVEWLLGFPVLTLSPILALIGGSVFLVKAALLNGAFYFAAVALFLTALPMAYLQNHYEPNYSITLLGVALATAFFLPGLKYYRQAKRN